MTQHKCYYNNKEALTSYEDTPEGGLLIHGVIIMAAGSWTDMHGIHTTFSEEVLQRCAGQWADNAVWTRHSGGTPRPVTEKVGAVLEPHYDPSQAAVVGDVLLHNKTDASASASALVRMDREQGGIKDVSAETIVEMDQRGNVTDVIFTGLALVEDGACEVCKLPAYGREENDSMTDTEDIKETVETKETEEVEETPKDDKAETKSDELLQMLAGFIEGLIPETKDIIAEVQASEGEDKVRALGKLEGCMAAWGFIPVEDFAKAIDGKLAEFSKTLDEKLESISQSVAQYGAPAGLKGKVGADKGTDGDKPQTIRCFGRGFTRFRMGR